MKGREATNAVPIIRSLTPNKEEDGAGGRREEGGEGLGGRREDGGGRERRRYNGGV